MKKTFMSKRSQLFNIFSIILILCMLCGISQPTYSQSDDGSDSFDAELNMAVQQAMRSYVEELPEESLHVTTITAIGEWCFGVAVIPAPLDEDLSPEASLFLARQIEQKWEVAIEYTPLFRTWINQVPDQFISHSTKTLLGSDPQSLKGDTSAQLSFPWPVGETWRFTGGPHGSPVWSALDFSGGSGSVRAAREGTAYIPCANFVLIKHADGWETGYYHLRNIAITNGQRVSRGQHIGYTSSLCGCGGSSTGPHVHFSLRRYGAHQRIHGHEVGGWTAINGSAPYNGCLSKNGVTKCQWGWIYNDGITISVCGGTDVVLNSYPGSDCPASRSLTLKPGFSATGGKTFRGYIR